MAAPTIAKPEESSNKEPDSPGEKDSSKVVSASRNAVVAYAKQFLGNPYVYGGTSLTNGADCSGFVMSVFSHFGINTGRSSREQAGKGKNDSGRSGAAGRSFVLCKRRLYQSCGDLCGEMERSSIPAIPLQVSAMRLLTTEPLQGSELLTDP